MRRRVEGCISTPIPSHVVFKIDKLKQLLSSSYPFVFSAILATIYGQTDKVMLKNMMNNDAVAYYSVAVTLSISLIQKTWLL